MGSAEPEPASVALMLAPARALAGKGRLSDLL